MGDLDEDEETKPLFGNQGFDICDGFFSDKAKSQRNSLMQQGPVTNLQPLHKIFKP